MRKHFMAVFLTLVLSIFICSSSIFAAHPLITDDAGTMGKGKAQVEMNFEYSQHKEGGVKVNVTDLSAILTYGVTDNVDIVLSVPYQFIKVKTEGETFKENGISDVSLELKWRFYQEKGVGCLALKPVLTLPTGDDDKRLGNGRATFGLYFIASKEINPVTLHLNLGYIRNENKFDDRKDLWHISLASEIEVMKELKLVANIGMERNSDRESNTHPAFILGGLIYTISEQIDIDFGVKTGLNKAEVDYSLLAGLTYRF